MRLVGDVIQDQGAQLTDGVGSVGQLIRAATGPVNLGQHGQGQRIAAAELGESADLVGHPEPDQQIAAVGVVQLVQSVHADQSTPARVQPPGGRGRLASRDDRDRSGGARREELGPEPAVQRRQQLVAVHQQHRRGVIGRPFADGREHGRRRALNVAGIQVGHPPPAAPGAASHGVEQGGLADPARTVDEHHPDVRAAGQRRGEQVELATATDETVVAGRAEATGELVAHRFGRGKVSRPELGSHHAVRVGLWFVGVEAFGRGPVRPLPATPPR